MNMEEINKELGILTDEWKLSRDTELPDDIIDEVKRKLGSSEFRLIKKSYLFAPEKFDKGLGNLLEESVSTLENGVFACDLSIAHGVYTVALIWKYDSESYFAISDPLIGRDALTEEEV